MIENVTIGTDFEVFLRDKNTKKIVSAEGYVKGTKQNPYLFDKRNKYFATSLDNVLAEANIPPSKTAYSFYKNIEKSLKFLNSDIPNNLETVIIPAARLEEKYLMTENAQLLGCEPDINSYTLNFNPKPLIKGENENLRSAGGHIHVGYDNPDQNTSIEIIKAMDLFIGVPSVIQESDNERKKLYGKAGACRFKNFGVEFRSISNYYLSSKELTQWAFNSTKKAIDYLNKNGIEQIIRDEEFIVNSINNNDKEMASKLIDKYKLKLA